MDHYASINSPTTMAYNLDLFYIAPGVTLCLNEQPRESVNSEDKSRYRYSEVNIRSMLAVHCTSLSWQDFRLTCALLGLQVPGRNMRQGGLDELVATTCKVFKTL